MQLAARSSFAAGVAVVGAGILVAAPVAPPPMPGLPDPVTTVRSTAVELTALANPLAAALTPVVRNASGPAEVLALAATPMSAPALAALTGIQLPTIPELLKVANDFLAVFGTALSDAPKQIQQAVSEIQAGQITAALNTLVNIVLTPVISPVLDAIFTGTGPLVELVGLLQRPFANVAPISNVIGLLADPDFLLTIGLGPLQTVYSLNAAVGGAVEGMLDAVEKGNPGAFVNSILKGIGDVTETVIDRLLNPGTPPAGLDRGLIAGLVEAGKMIWAALTKPATPPQPVLAVAATSTEPAMTVTLSTDTAAAPVGDPEPTAPVSDTVVPDDTTVSDEIDETEEDVPAEPAADEAAVDEDDEPEVRTGLVAVPGEVTVGVTDDTTDEAAEQDSTASEDGGASTGDTAGTGSDTGPSDTNGAGDSTDGGDAGASGGGSGPGDGGGSGDTE